ncbi:MAG: cytidine deaminase [Rhodothermaceae bacterium]|nr:cytidine deaminase [Rhodothermaceae bacterium]
MEESIANRLRHRVRAAASRSRVPYSGRPRAALALMSDGRWMCGVRIENASYPLVIPALSAVLASANSIGRRDITALVFSDRVKLEEKTMIQQSFTGPMEQLAEDILGHPEDINGPGDELIAGRHFPDKLDTVTGIRLARQATQHAYTPESDFPVGALVVTRDQTCYQGVNVEHGDWTQMLCAERAAIAAAVGAGETNIQHIYVSCPKAPATATPCGACRQVLGEIAPEANLWMDRGEQTAECFSTRELLPMAFSL